METNDKIANDALQARKNAFISNMVATNDLIDEVSPLPFHFSKDGFRQPYGWQKGPVYPVIYSAHDDLEMICRVPKDSLLIHSKQNNIANGMYISEACSNYPRALQVLEEVLIEHIAMAELRDIYRHKLGLTKETIDKRINMLEKKRTTTETI